MYRQQSTDVTPEQAAVLGTEYLISDYPATQALLAGGVLVVNGNDPDADPAELAILDGMAAVSVAMSGCLDHDGTRWLVEVFGDALSGSMSDIALPMRTLVAIAIHEAAAS